MLITPWPYSYFTAATPSIDRHIYSIPLPTSASNDDEADQDASMSSMTALTDTTSPGYFEASFSPKAGYYVLGYRGPEVPWQRLIEAGSGDDREYFFGGRGVFRLGGNADEMFFLSLFFLFSLRVGMKRSGCVIGR